MTQRTTPRTNVAGTHVEELGDDIAAVVEGKPLTAEERDALREYLRHLRKQAGLCRCGRASMYETGECVKHGVRFK